MLVSARRGLGGFLLCLVAAVMAGCGSSQRSGQPAAPAGVAVSPDFVQLSGWAGDNHSAAIPALLQSCPRMVSRSSATPISYGGVDGTYGEWQSICQAAQRVPAGNSEAARQFFEQWFVPVPVASGARAGGLFTGYFAPVLRGSWQPDSRYSVPLYRMPPRGRGRLPTRAQIADGALAGRGLEILWVDDPIDAFFLEIQGSGYVQMEDGTRVHLGYDGQNGHRYYAIGRALIDREIATREEMSMQLIRGWLEANPGEAQDLMNLNPSYIFFEIRDGSVRGAQDVPLTDGRSLAVDRDYIPLGTPLWIDLTNAPTSTGRIQRLVIAQDVGGAIQGQVRGDLFWGSGDVAAESAGRMQARGGYYMLVPRSAFGRNVAER